MRPQRLDELQHEHSFGQEVAKAGESRTRIVIAMTAATMVVEIAAGVAYGSMALLADGLHMASHAAALGISAIAYSYARRHAHDERYSFGTGKVNALAGFTGAILLAVFSLAMAVESVKRFVEPVDIVFESAIWVAVAGLAVNAISVAVLGGHDHHEHEHEHEHGHGHADHNLRAAYLHVLADALTSLTAIFALLAGLYFGATWMDPAMGIVGSILVARWSWGLLRDSSHVLLDRQAPDSIREQLRSALEGEADHVVADLHVWSVGPAIYAAAISLVADAPESPEFYRARVPSGLGIVHATIEVHSVD